MSRREMSRPSWAQSLALSLGCASSAAQALSSSSVGASPRHSARTHRLLGPFGARPIGRPLGARPVRPATMPSLRSRRQPASPGVPAVCSTLSWLTKQPGFQPGNTHADSPCRRLCVTARATFAPAQS
ncbi:hypothetical protein T492DRAFT_991701 [Pavlovales sp. CCMP2436]|nr:hypothetical protein T492DRAFT_991701 [Pavlovales sp. CCMP2436]